MSKFCVDDPLKALAELLCQKADLLFALQAMVNEFRHAPDCVSDSDTYQSYERTAVIHAAEAAIEKALGRQA
jgi:hypothetical protein